MKANNSKFHKSTRQVVSWGQAPNPAPRLSDLPRSGNNAFLLLFLEKEESHKYNERIVVKQLTLRLGVFKKGIF
jgi:hypothetical protein